MKAVFQYQLLNNIRINCGDVLAGLKDGLGLFEVMNLVIGAIVGADIYIAASFGAGFLGPYHSWHGS